MSACRDLWSVCRYGGACVGESVLCSISATVYEHMVELAKEWQS